MSIMQSEKLQTFPTPIANILNGYDPLLLKDLGIILIQKCMNELLCRKEKKRAHIAIHRE